MIVIGLVARLIRKLLRLVFLGWVDRIFGVVFGGAKGGLIVTIVFIMMTTFLPGGHVFFKDSKTAPYLAGAAQILTVFVAQNVKVDFNSHIKGLKQAWEI